MGELLVGAYLEKVVGCDHVQYNVRAPGGGTKGLSELDVIGVKYADKEAWLCEVTTHVKGAIIGGSYASTVQKLRQKHAFQREYAAKYLDWCESPHFQWWSPRVPVGKMSAQIEAIEGLEVVANHDYARRIDDLVEVARKDHSASGNDAFRVLQILGALRR